MEILKIFKKQWKIQGQSTSKVCHHSILGPLFGAFRSLQGGLGATPGRQVAPQDPFFQCFFRRANRRADLLKFEYLPTFFNDFDPSGGFIFDVIFETLFFLEFFHTAFENIFIEF